MSRGLGRIQLKVLAVLKAKGYMDSISIAGAVFKKRTVDHSEAVSVRRALCTLARDGLVEDMGRHWNDGRRRWGLPEQVAAYNKRVQNVFGNRTGKSIPANRRKGR